MAMDATARAAAGAYQALSRIGQGAAGSVGGARPPAGGNDFAGVLRQAMGGVADQVRAGEARTQAFAAGRAELVDVVTAVAETEVALDTLVAVRDKVIQSYEEIMKMPI